MLAQDLARSSSAIAARGVLAIIFGILVLVWPQLTLLVLIYAFGIFVLLQGIAAVAAGLARPGGGVSWGLVGLGIIGILAGIAALAWPGLTGLALLYLIGIWAIAEGIVVIYAGVQLRQQVANEWLLILAGVVAVIFGILVLAAPGAGALAVASLIGFFAIIYGVLQLALAYRLRSAAERGQP